MVGTKLAIELFTQGVTLEVGHKALHVLIAIWAVVIVIKNFEMQYRAFALFNGILWGSVAIIGWTFPDFLGLKAFGRADTILHTIVAATGLFAGLKR